LEHSFLLMVLLTSPFPQPPRGRFRSAAVVLGLSLFPALIVILLDV